MIIGNNFVSPPDPGHNHIKAIKMKPRLWGFILPCKTEQGLPRWFSSKESACNAGVTGDTGPIPGSGRSPGEGHGNPLQYSCLENPTNREAWWATVYKVSKSRTRLKQLSRKAGMTQQVKITQATQISACLGSNFKHGRAVSLCLVHMQCLYYV